MDHDIELLNETYRNAELSKDILGRLIKICKDASFRCVMASQFAEYHAVLLEAGLRGIANEYELPEEIDGDLRDLSPRERKVIGYQALPTSLDEALTAMEESELVAETLGEQLYSWFLDNKHNEWRQYRAQVTEFELRHGLTHF